MVKKRNTTQIRLDGNALCLDFVNTIHDRINEPRSDYLNTFAEFLQWATKAGVINLKMQTAFAETVNEKADMNLLNETLSVRELLYRIFLAVCHKKKITTDDLQAFNLLLSDSLSRLTIAPEKNSYATKWKSQSGDLFTITAPIIYSTYQLLLSGKLHRVKECPGCGWLFLDTTKNGKRRWCSMETCGSSVKALEWYYRQKK